MSVRTARTVRIRVLATVAAVVATLVLTGCKDGMGVRDEGPSGVTPTSTQSTH